jgi:hypothetical protein
MLRRVAVVVMVVLGLAAPAVAQQPEPTPSELALARQEFATGMEAARAGRWAVARESFARAFELSRRPRILANLAAADAELGLLIEAADDYRRLLRLEPGNATERAAIERAITGVEARTPRLTIVVERMVEGDQVTVDGEPVSAAAIGRPLPMNPGERRLEVIRRRQVVAQDTITLAERETRTLTLTVDPAAAITRLPEISPIDSTRPPRGTRTPADTEPDPDPDPRNPIDEGEGGSIFASGWFWFAVGLVAVGATVGVLLATGGSSEDPFDGNLGPGSWTIR